MQLPITARQLREFALLAKPAGFLSSLLAGLPADRQGTVPVASQYGAIFAITVREGFITIAVQVVC